MTMKLQRYGQQILLILVASLLLLGCTPASESTDRVLANPRQANSSWIDDSAELLNPQIEGELNHRINQLVARTTAEMAIVTVPSVTPPQSPRSNALALFNRWGIGKKEQNNGVLLFVSSASQRVEIITGTGLVDFLPDSQVSESIQQQILPAFRQGNYAAGIVQGTNAIAEMLEAGLPSTALPLGVPLRLGIGAAVLVGVGYAALALFVRIPKKQLVPTQGANEDQFEGRMGTLQADTLPKLFHRLFAANQSQEEIPWLGLICLWLGGAGLGIALALAWHTWLSPNPAWGSWYSIVGSFVIYAIATSFAALLPAVVQQLSSEEAFLGILFALMFSLSGCIVLAKDITNVTWAWLAGGIFGLNVANVIGLSIGCGGLMLKRPWRYLCQGSGQDSGQIPQELSAQELADVLTPSERLGMAMGNLSFRGWRDPRITAPVTREQVYLVRGKNSDTQACEQCQAYTVAKTVRPIQTEPNLPQPPQVLSKRQQQRRQKKQKKTPASAETSQYQGLEETVFTCHACGYERVIQPSRLNLSFDRYLDLRGAETGTTPPDTSSSDRSYDSYNSSYDNYNSGNDPSGYDFGGGSSDGGGSGGDW